MTQHWYPKAVQAHHPPGTPTLTHLQYAGDPQAVRRCHDHVQVQRRERRRECCLNLLLRFCRTLPLPKATARRQALQNCRGVLQRHLVADGSGVGLEPQGRAALQAHLLQRQRRLQRVPVEVDKYLVQAEPGAAGAIQCQALQHADGKLVRCPAWCWRWRALVAHAPGLVPTLGPSVRPRVPERGQKSAPNIK